jgi:hypothetical protein
MDKKFHHKTLTLTDADISSQRRVSRRSILSALGVGLGVAAAAVVGHSVPLAAQGRTGCTDTDMGRNEDPPDMGIRCQPRAPRAMRPTGCSDPDRGPNEDPQGYGVRCQLWI